MTKTLKIVLAVWLAALSFNAAAAGYYTQAGKIYDAGGTEIQVRGLSHYGFNTPILQPQFLWNQDWKAQLDQIKSLGFNVVRCPFTPDTLYNTTPINTLSYLKGGPGNDLFVGKTSLQALDLWMQYADSIGLYVLLDFHSVTTQRLYPTWFVSNPADFPLVYNKAAYPKESWVRDLTFVATRYASVSRFIGIDIYNEPNGVVRWNAGDPNMTNAANYWQPAAELAAAAVLAANPKLLIFVQGINGNFDGKEINVPMNYGEDLQPQAYQPLNIPIDKLVLSPHTYGPDVYMKSSFSAANFPANLPANWDILFGQFFAKHPVVVGEWGGKYGNGTGGQKDVTWQNALVDYMIARGVRNSIYWTYTPNSGDTGGILDDQLNVRQDKMALLQKLWAATPVTPQTCTCTCQCTITP